MIAEEKLNILSINGTWFHYDTTDATYDDITPVGYYVINAPRQDRHHSGGATIVYHDTFKVSRILVKEICSTYKVLIVKVIIGLRVF